MLENVIEDEEFARIMQKNIQDIIVYFFEREQNFGILCKIESVSFDPDLPEDIKKDLRSLTLFFLAGYSLETAHIVDNMLIFEAGFGSENFGSIVNVPLLSIMQVIVDETPLLINLSTFKEKLPTQDEGVDDDGVQNSMASFLNNPENSKFLK